MSGLTQWAKSNLLVVIALVVSVVVLGGSFFFSSGWNKKIRESLNESATKTLTSINGYMVTYEVPPLSSDAQPWTSDRRYPNDRTTSEVGTLLEQIVAQSERVRQYIVERNRAGKTVLVPGLFPEPANPQSQRVPLSAEMMRAWPAAHAAMLEAAGAGGPLPASAMLDDLQRFADQRRARLLQDRVDQQLTAEEQSEIRDELSARRVGLLRAHAEGVLFYADAGVFTALSRVPADLAPPPAETYLQQFWDWQHMLWMHQDLVAAFEAANEGAGSVVNGPLKRVLRVAVDDARYSEVAKDADLAKPIERDYSTTHTGRKTGTPLYDLRFADVTLIVEVSRLNEVLNAISSTNFMTVVGQQVRVLGPGEGIGEGYFYGEGSLARVDLRVETLWIRSWMQPLMPPPVRAAMGLPERDTPAGGEDEANEG